MNQQVQTRSLAGIDFSMATLSEATRLLCRIPKEVNSGVDIHLLNAYSIALAEKDTEFDDCLKSAVLNLPDGKPLSVLTKWSKKPLNQVRGPSLFEAVLDKGRDHSLRHFLLGTTPETLALLKESLELRYPGVQIVGSISPPFRPLTDAEYTCQDAQIKETSPDIVWVGLGTPKQDFEAQRLARQSEFVAVAVGAAFDFSAGLKKEAPMWMRHLGMEWIFRFASEPGRLWKRYLFGNATFLKAVLFSN